MTTATSLRFRLYDHYASVFQESYQRYLKQHQLLAKDYSEHRYAKDLLIEALDGAALKELSQQLGRVETTLPQLFQNCLAQSFKTQATDLKRVIARALFFSLCEVGHLPVEEAQQVANLFAPNAVRFRTPDSDAQH